MTGKRQLSISYDWTRSLPLIRPANDCSFQACIMKIPAYPKWKAAILSESYFTLVSIASLFTYKWSLGSKSEQLHDSIGSLIGMKVCARS